MTGSLRSNRLLLAAGPLVLLAGVIGLFIFTRGAGLNIVPAAPIETVQFGRTTLTPGRIEINVRNTSPEAISVSQVNINDAIWPYTISPQRTIPRLGNAVVTLDYPWVQGEAYEIAILSGNSVLFGTSVEVAAETATTTAGTLWSFTLIGIYVGLIPVILGMLWLPLLQGMSSGGKAFLTAATVGLLLYLGIDATSEALELGGELGGAFQGTGLVGIGIVGAWLLLDSMNRRQRTIAQSESGRRMSLATVIAIGIGLHNLGEGLAIGAAFSIGAASLGTFLVIGFILQNITEGLGIVMPLASDKPSLASLARLGVIGGAPAIAGTWIGGLIYSRPLSVLFLAIGAGAVFQVAYEIARQLRPAVKEKSSPLVTFGGVLTGMLVLYVTGLVIK